MQNIYVVWYLNVYTFIQEIDDPEISVILQIVKG